MLRRFALIYILVFATSSQANSQSKSGLNFVPLNVVDTWEYRVTPEGLFGKDPYYGYRTILGDTVLSDGLTYKVVLNHRLDFFPVGWRAEAGGDSLEFVRVDSLSTDVYVMIGDVTLRVDSLAMDPGDYIPGGGAPPTWFGPVTCQGPDTLLIFGNEITARATATNTGVESGYTETMVYAPGIGYLSRVFSDNLQNGIITEDLVYAKIDGTEYGLFVGVMEKSPVLETPSLYQNFPNPFNPSTVISYELTIRTHVVLRIFDVIGRLITTVIDADQNSGLHSVVLDASGLASGIYFYTLKAGNHVASKKMLHVK